MTKTEMLSIINTEIPASSEVKSFHIKFVSNSVDTNLLANQARENIKIKKLTSQITYESDTE